MYFNPGMASLRRDIVVGIQSKRIEGGRKWTSNVSRSEGAATRAQQLGPTSLECVWLQPRLLRLYSWQRSTRARFHSSVSASSQLEVGPGSGNGPPSA
jgi:hypothetical protein